MSRHWHDNRAGHPDHADGRDCDGYPLGPGEACAHAPLPGDETKPDLSDLPESPVPADRVLAIDPEDPERKITT